MEFSRQEYWSELPFPTPGDLPNLEMEPRSLVAPALAGRFFTAAPPGKSKDYKGGPTKDVRSLDPKTEKVLEEK